MKMAGRFMLVRAHDQAGRGLVAAAHQHAAVHGMRAQDLLGLHGEQVAIEHRGRLLKVLGQRHRRDFDRESARLPHAALHLFDALLEVHVAGADVAPGVEDADDGLAGVVGAVVAHLRDAGALAERAEVVRAYQRALRRSPGDLRGVTGKILAQTSANNAAPIELTSPLGGLMKFALLSVTYSGLFYNGPALSVVEQIRKARALGFDGLSIETKRPVASPLDLTSADRKAIRAAAAAEGITLCAIESLSNFASQLMEERENNLAMMRLTIDLASDLEIPVVKVFAAWPGIIDDEDDTALYAPYERAATTPSSTRRISGSGGARWTG